MKKTTILTVTLFLLLLMSIPAHAIPELQLYIEGASYDTGTQTWVRIMNSSDIILWTLGNVGQKGTISDVMLSAAYNSDETGTITFTPTTATGTGITDPSTPIAPYIFTTGIGTIPLMGDGSPLAPHEIYGSGVSWTQYSLGDFSLTDSPIGDYITSVPTTFPATGQINAYKVDITGYTWVHFDAFDHVVAGNKAKYVFAPFSHDGEVHSPEPATMLLMGFGLLGLSLKMRRKKSV